MTGINSFDISKYDVGGTQNGDKAGDKKLTGDEARKARADGWTVWDGFVEGDKVEHVENKDLKSGLMQLLKTFFNMRQSDSYKKFSERKEAILEQKMAEHKIYPSKVNGKNVWDWTSNIYKQAEKEADIQARKEFGLSETTFDIGKKVNSQSGDKTEDKEDNTDKPPFLEGINSETIKKLASNIKYTAEVDKIFSQILKDKYSIDTTDKELDELKKLREQYKEDFEAAKAQAKEKLGFENPEYFEITSGTKRTAGTKKTGGAKKTTGGKKTSNTYQETAYSNIYKKGDKYYIKENGKYREVICKGMHNGFNYKIIQINKDGSYILMSNRAKNGRSFKEYYDNNGNCTKMVTYQNGKLCAVHDGDNGAGYFGRVTNYDENGKPINTKYIKKGDKDGTYVKVRNHRTGQWEKP